MELRSTDPLSRSNATGSTLPLSVSESEPNPSVGSNATPSTKGEADACIRWRAMEGAALMRRSAAQWYRERSPNTSWAIRSGLRCRK